MNRENTLKKEYYDNENGLKSIAKFYKFIKDKYPDKGFSLKEIKDFVEKQKTDQVFKQVSNKNRYNQIVAYYIGDVVNFDIMDVNYYKQYNKGYRFILVCVDVYSRRIFLRALKDKSAKNTMRGVLSIEDDFKEKNYKIKGICADSGNEFNNKLFLNHYKDIKDRIFFKDPDIHNSALAIIDRTIRTLRTLFNRLFVANGNYLWINDLYKIERNFNNTFHSTIKNEPITVWDSNVKLNFEPIREVETLNVNDHVRVLIKKNQFDSKNLQKWSDRVYKVIKREGVGYLINDDSNKKYFISELLKVDSKSENGDDNVISKIRKNNLVNNRLSRLNKNLN